MKRRVSASRANGLYSVLQVALTAIIVSSLGANPARAHHSYAATYDVKQPVMVEGVVSKMSWRNPHAFLFVEAENEDGELVIWEFEMSPVVMLIRYGWKPEMLNDGDPVTVHGFKARTGSALRAAARDVTFNDGSTLIAGPGEGAIEGGAR
jgi:hypothetical protein